MSRKYVKYAVYVMCLLHGLVVVSYVFFFVFGYILLCFIYYVVLRSVVLNFGMLCDVM